MVVQINGIQDIFTSNPKPFINTKPFQNSFSSPSIRTSTYLLDFFGNNLQDEREPDEQQTPLDENEQNKIMLQFFQQAQKFYAKGMEPRKSRLVVS